MVLIHEYRDRRVVHETSYYGAPFEAPGNAVAMRKTV